MKPQEKKELTEREVKDLLTPRQRPVPPADLAERIKRDIPADLPVVAALAEAVEAPATPPMSGSRIWLMAASVVLAVGGGFLALRWMDRMPTPAETATVTARIDAVASEQELGQATGDVRSSAPAGPAAAEPQSSVEPGARALEAPAEPIVARAGAEGASGPEPGDRDLVGRDGATATRGSLSVKAEASPSENLEIARASRRDVLAQQESSDLERQPAVQPPPEPDPEVVLPLPKAKLEAPPPPPSSPPPPPMASRPPATSRAPVTPSRDKKRVRTREEQLRALGYSGDDHFNRQISSENAAISDMKEEARQLEAELKALEESLAAPTAGASIAVAPPSTGGTAEPNDAPYGDVFFESAGTNPFIDTEDDALSTFGLDVDTGSYTVARRYLRDGNLPPHAAIRVEEFINYFDYGDPAPAKDEFAIHAEGAPSIYGQGERYYLLRFNLSGRELAQADRRPALLTFVVDVSGSMQQENRLGLVKQALALLIDQLRADDRLALVIYGTRGQVVLQPTGDHGAIRRAIDGLRTGGSTNAEEGLELAYELAARHRRRGAINRVILCSDGVANVGATSANSILDRIRREANQGIELTTVGFGMGNYNDVLMERLADTGNGRYAYVDTIDEARRIFVENLTGTLQTLAAEARVQVDFDPKTVSLYRLLGYENRDIADDRFRDDTVDAGEIGVGHKVTALYEIKTSRPLRDADRVGTLSLRYGSVDRREMVEVARTVTGADFARRWETASPALKLTSLVAEYAEILKRSYWAREGDLDDVFRRAQRVSAQFEGDREVADFVSLVGRAAEYREREKR